MHHRRGSTGRNTEQVCTHQLVNKCFLGNNSQLGPKTEPLGSVKEIETNQQIRFTKSSINPLRER